MTYTDQQIVQDLANSKSATKGTSLVTLYVSGNSNMNNVSNTLISELSSSQNIKSKQTRTAVQSALKSIQQIVKSLPHIAPENGLVLLGGELNYSI
jgi:peptide chain release factor subunit 1